VSDVDLDEPFVIDRKASERFPIYTRANVGEVWPGPATPLTFSTQAGLRFEQAWRNALVRFGAFDPDEFESEDEVFIGIFFGYPYLNVSIQRVFGVRMPGASVDLIDASFFGGQEGVPPYQRDGRDESSQHTERITNMIGAILSAAEAPDVDAAAKDVAELRTNRPDFGTLSNEQLWEYAEPLITERFGDMMDEHMFITSAGAIPIGMVQATASALGDPGLAMRALSGLGDVVSAAPAYAMWDLSRIVATSSKLTALFDAGITGLLDRIRASDDVDAAAFLRQFDELLLEYGARGPNEMDLGTDTWETDPEMALTAVERMRLQPDSASPRTGRERMTSDREQVVAQILDGVAADPEAQSQVSAGLRAAAVWLPARELSKLNTVRLQHEARMALRELGRRMVEADVFTAVTDFVMLRADEFPQFLADPASWTDEISKRRDWFEQLKHVEPPFITTGALPPPSTWRHRTVSHLPPVTEGEVITGIAACPGIATGIARVITDPTFGGDLEPGDVLIAASTDPSWTPLFVSAAAVVVDVGAPLSHAAIVSRELGVPCVVSATNASRRIPDGARITVDRTAGTVTIHELAGVPS
jgi:rifampicin phosphotransferase